MTDIHSSWVNKMWATLQAPPFTNLNPDFILATFRLVLGIKLIGNKNLSVIECSWYTLIALETGSFTALNTKPEEFLVVKFVGYIHQVHTVASMLQFI